MQAAKYSLLNFGMRLLTQRREALDFAEFHPRRSMLAKAHAETVEFITREMPDAIGFETPRQLLEHAIAAVALDGIVAEFGVNRGGTINTIARRMPERVVHGFDSFEGLPENWHGNNLAAGHFGRGGKLPRVASNVTLHAGWFDKTVPPFAAALDRPIAFLHVDCDIYSSTVTIFTHLARFIVPGTVILFDEYFNYPNWQAHEHKAFREFVERENRTFTPLGYAYEQVAVLMRPSPQDRVMAATPSNSGAT